MACVFACADPLSLEACFQEWLAQMLQNPATSIPQQQRPITGAVNCSARRCSTTNKHRIPYCVTFHDLVVRSVSVHVARSCVHCLAFPQALSVARSDPP